MLCAVLAKGASLRFRAKGRSMFPAIRNGDVVTVSPIDPAGLRQGDIAAFVSGGNDRLAIHRVLSARGGAFLFGGDNALFADGWIASSQVLGRVTKVERNGQGVRLGLGPERGLVAWMSRTGALRFALIACNACLSAFRWGGGLLKPMALRISRRRSQRLGRRVRPNGLPWPEKPK